MPLFESLVDMLNLKFINEPVRNRAAVAFSPSSCRMNTLRSLAARVAARLKAQADPGIGPRDAFLSWQ
jgi:hypothetical protein